MPFDITSDPFVLLLKKHKDWTLMTKETRFEKTGRIKFVCSLKKKDGTPLYGAVYISAHGTLHYEHKTITRVVVGRRRLRMIGRRLQQRPLPESYNQFLRLLHELNQLAALMAKSPTWFHGWDGDMLRPQKLYLANVN